jgi:DNA polymerase-3 subunit epsilon
LRIVRAVGERSAAGGNAVTKIVVLDVETTGKEKATDQIIEICLRFGLDSEAESRTWRIKPSVPIHPEATAVHGITMEALAECPSFPAVVSEFLPEINGAKVLVGYNVSFDFDMIQSELSRAGLPPLDFTGKEIIDVLRLWHYNEPRTLVAAHAKFCGQELVDAHQASADVAATARVLVSMLSTFGLADKPWPEIAAISDPFANRVAWIGPSPHIQWNESGAIVFGFGKYKGQQVVHADAGFLRWILAKDFPPHVNKICQVVLERRHHFNEWISQYYPRPISKTAASPQSSQDHDPFGADAAGEIPVQGSLL